MAKKKTSGLSTQSRRTIEQLSIATELLEHGRAVEALPVLEKLHQANPRSEGILFPLVQAYHDMHDLNGYERALRRLYKLESHSPEIVLSLAGAYLLNDRPVLALRTFQGFLQRWPEHPGTDDALKAVVALKKEVREQIEKTGLDEEEAVELLINHEELRFYLKNGQFQQGQRIAETILQLQSGFFPALNNLGQIYAAQGKIDRAIEIAQKVLAIQPDNVHALSNLARLHFLNGEPGEAQLYATKLKSSSTDAADRWTKVAEAFSFLGDDEGVLELHRLAKEAGELKPGYVDELFYHLAAVSACRLGQIKKARSYWKESLRINLNFDWASQNLADLDKPPEERHGPWAFPFESWLLSATVRDLLRILDQYKNARKKTAIQKAVTQFLATHPQVIFLAPHLVERGDEKASEFVYRLAAVSGHPELLKAAISFLTGQRGSFDRRMQCAKMLSEAEILKSGPLRMWTGHAWSDILLLNFEIDPKPGDENLPEAVEKLSQKAWEALNERDGHRAQAVLEEAIALWPEDPHLLNNLALAYELQGRSEKAHQMIYEIHSRYPEYFFGVVGVARLAITNRKLEQAHGLLESLMNRRKLHTSEFNALCMAEIELWLAEGKTEAAKTWLGMWESVDPENPELPRFRRRVGIPRQKGPRQDKHL